MRELSRESKALLDEARGGDDPTVSDRARIRTRLIAQLGAGVALTASATAASTAAASGAVGGAAVGTAAGSAVAGGLGSSLGVLLAKVVLTVAVVGGASAGGVTVYRTRQVHNERAVLAAAPVVAPSPFNAPSDVNRVLSATPVPTSIPDDTPRPSATNAPPSRTAAVAVGAHPPSTLPVEVGLLDEAGVALREGRATQALALFDEHASRFPNGVLAEERAAGRVFALCKLGRIGEARSDADRFLRERPRSPLAERVRASCGGNP
jgi:hypothetical protein